MTPQWPAAWWLGTGAVWCGVALLRTALWWAPRPTGPRLVAGLAIFGLSALFWSLVTRAMAAGLHAARRFAARPWSQRVALIISSGAVVVLEAAWWRGAVRLVTGRPAIGTLAYTTFNNLDTTLIMLGAALVVLLAIERRRAVTAAIVRTERLAASLAEVRLHVLGFQLQPHFLFNTLHVLSELVHRGDDSARQLASRLRDLFVSASDPETPAEITLAEEVGLVRSYLAIQEMRFETRLTVEVSVPPDLAGALVPRFLLQPLVENAIRHGTEPRIGAGAIRITASRDGEMLRIAVTDNGGGPGSAFGGPEGFGLRNTRERLAQLYGDRQELTLSQVSMGGAEAAVRLPYHSVPISDPTDAPDSEGAAPLPGVTRGPVSRLSRAALLLVGAAAVAMVWILQEAALARLAWSPFGLASSAMRNGLAVVPWVVAFPLVAAVTARWPVDGDRRLAISAHALAAIVLAAAMVMTRRFSGAAGSTGPWYGPSLAYVVVITVAGYALGAAAAHGILAERARDRELVRMARVDADLSRARLELVRWGIQPELLVSVLEDVGKLTQSDPDQADRLVVALGDFLRAVLAGVARKTSLLGDECACAEAYLALERTRGRVGPDSRLDCPEEARDVKCAPLAVVAALWQVIRETGVNARFIVVSDPGGLGIRVAPFPEAGGPGVVPPAGHLLRMELA